MNFIKFGSHWFRNSFKATGQNDNHLWRLWHRTHRGVIWRKKLDDRSSANNGIRSDRTVAPETTFCTVKTMDDTSFGGG